MLLLLVIPIFASIEKRESLLRRSKKKSKIVQLGINSPKETQSAILPERPLHLSGLVYINNDWDVVFTDKTIHIVRRSYDYYYKCVMSYKSEIKNDIIELSAIEVDETNSLFLFSSRNELGDCDVDYGKEYSYKYNYYNSY